MCVYATTYRLDAQVGLQVLLQGKEELGWAPASRQTLTMAPQAHGKDLKNEAQVAHRDEGVED